MSPESESANEKQQQSSRRAAFITAFLLIASVFLISRGPYVPRDRRSSYDDESPPAREPLTKAVAPSPYESSSPSSFDFDFSTSNNSSNTVDAPDMPVLPLSSQRARSKMWRRVTATVDVDQSNSVIAQHRRACSDKQRSIRFEDLSADEKLTDNVDFLVFGFGDSWHQTEYAGHKKLHHAQSSTRHHHNSRQQRQKQPVSAGFRRIFVALVLTSKRNRPRICSNGAVIEAALESQQDMIDVDFMLEVAPGLYELQPFFRRSGRYSLCMALAALSPHFKSTMTPATFFVQDSSSSAPVRLEVARKEVKQSSGPSQYCVGHKWSNQRQCFDEDVQLAADSVSALQQRLKKLRGGRRCGAKPGEPGSRQDFRSGAWTRLLQCDGDQCTGDPTKALPSVSEEQKQSDIAAGGMWVFVSDTCTVKLYSRREAWRVVDAQWILNWGGSTLKQPAANFLEYTLGVPVFEVSMERLDSIKNTKRGGGGGGSPGSGGKTKLKLKAAKVRGFFSYRQYEALKTWRDSSGAGGGETRMLRSTMCWGGCPGMMQPPSCGLAMGMNNRACARAALQDGQPSLASIKPYSSKIPSVILINHFVWRWPLDNETQFMEQLEDTIRWVRKIVAQRLEAIAKNSSSSSCTKRPLLAWIGPVRSIYADEEAGHCGQGLALSRRLAWKIERFFERYREQESFLSTESTPCYSSSSSSSSSPFRDVLYFARTELTSPHHTGSRFGHFGVHYGATRGMCLTGMSRNDRYSMHKCLRNTSADWMLIHWWLNAMDGSDG